jgi:hypothetical protein
MRFYVANTTRDFITAPNAEGATATEENPKQVRGCSQELVELQFLDGESGAHAPALYPEGTEILWELKRVGEYTGDAVIPAISFTRPATAAEFYTGYLDTSLPDVLSALMDADSNVSNDLDSIALAGEITILLPTATVPMRTQIANVTVENYYQQEGGPLGTYMDSPSGGSNTGGTPRIVATLYMDNPDLTLELTLVGAFDSGGTGRVNFTGFTALHTLTFSGVTGLTAIDLRPCVALESVSADSIGLTTLLVSSTAPIIFVEATGNALTAASVDAILIALDANGETGGVVNLASGTSAAPTSASAAARTSLTGKTWTITTN